MKLTIHEVAESLDLPLNTIERWIRQGKIPIRKSGNVYIINETTLKKWADTHNLPFSLSQKKKYQDKNPGADNLLSAMQRGSVLYNIKGQTPEEILQCAVDNIPDSLIKSKEELFTALIEREALGSTGIGNGVAVPHPRTPLSKMQDNSAIITCFPDKPVDFKAIDNKPVFILFILLSVSVKIHLHLLSRISFCARNQTFIDFLKTTPAPDAIYARIADYEKELDQAGSF